MRQVWDAAARTGSEIYIGRWDAAAAQLDRLFGQLGATIDPRAVCVEVGCGAGRMTGELARRFREVVAVDVSPAMLEQAREHVRASNVRFALTGGLLDGIPDTSADIAVCFGVIQHLPTRRDVVRLFSEIARVLRPSGEALLQLPVLDGGLRPRAWRLRRSARLHLLPARTFESSPAYRGTRLTAAELDAALAAARLTVVRRVDGDDDPTLNSRYPYAQDTRLRVSRGS